MRWIVVTAAASALCLVGLVVLKNRLNRQEAIERTAVIDYAGAAAKRLAEPDAPFPATPPRDYVAEVSQIVPQLGDADEDTRSAALDVLASLPGDAYSAVRSASENKKTEKAAQAALSGVLNRFSRRMNREQTQRIERVRMLRELLGAYDHFGHHDPKWDDRARAALTSFFETGPTPHRSAAQETWIVNAIEKVISDARCDDPAILFAYGCMIDELQTRRLNSGNDSTQIFQQATTKAAQDNWPAPWQSLFNARALATRSQLTFKSPDQLSTRLNLDQAVGFLSNDWLPNQTKLDWSRKMLVSEMQSQQLIKAMGVLGGVLPKVDAEADFRQLHEAMEKQFPGQVEPLLVTGDFYLNYAWQGRGSDYAYTVTDQGWKLLHERLLIAKESLEKAYELDPSNPVTCEDMLVACRGLDEDVSTTQRWFARAMSADPDDHEAVEQALEYLEPKWHGSADSLLKFARGLGATHNYRSRMPLAIAEAHERLAAYEPSVDKYLAQSAVWEEIRVAYESYLSLFPNDREQRTHYAYDAARAGKSKQAQSQFSILGDDPWPNIFPNDSYDSFRSKS